MGITFPKSVGPLKTTSKLPASFSVYTNFWKVTLVAAGAVAVCAVDSGAVAVFGSCVVIDHSFASGKI